MEPYLDQRFIPHVRGISYHEHTSRGALTLISLAWQLAIFERAVELGHAHPGFVDRQSATGARATRRGNVKASRFA